ncbi:putative endo-1,3(4)-beta-glucanase [Aspergillus ellipticus CBS 707.79]|uniref:endo-1,3(4)-beta-glucanase n=1 Tax=Aspergillus ellipticus CBS 707.79 TaxID=1448320 RepID=A0A319D6G8_9EURO|nr:putative endo-1,3(4)-beta-glucanase [Aspergillus ellipticus CBS 707.79]
MADDLSRYGGATTQLPKLEMDDLQHAGPPPPPGSGQVITPQRQPTAATSAWYNPRGWSLRTKLIVVGVVIVVIIAVVVGAVEGTKKKAYPDYSKLNYKLVDTYSGTSFFDRFDYYSGVDPTDGFVQYINQSTSSSLNLTYATDDSVVIKVDTSNKNAIDGRQSVRLESKMSYDTGLFIFDIIHTPYACGLWPALWLTDTYNWPENGEIDVLETNNLATEGNAVTLHTTTGCKMNVKRKETGTPNYVTCANDTHSNAGCGVQGTPSTYGKEMNANGGGVYALELRDAGIRAWFFSRDSIPDDIDSSAAPDPSTWGTALADFPSTHCPISTHFKNQSIITNIDLCGQLGANHQFYTEQYHCPGTCKSFVRSNPSNFTEAYWEFKSFKVYQSN